MAILLPFSFNEKTGNPVKITKAQDVETWINLKDTINNLISRCNIANSTTIAPISLVNQNTKGSFLTSEEYDANIVIIETAINQIIVASEDQGLNPSNLMTLYKRGGQSTPLYMFHRDTNLKTIQTVINAINQLYIWDI